MASKTSQAKIHEQIPVKGHGEIQGKRPPQAPPMFNDSAESIISSMQGIINRSQSLMDKIVEKISVDAATFDNVLLPLAHQDNAEALQSELLTFYQAVSDDQSLRDASTKAENMIKDFSVESSMREDVFLRVKAVYEASAKHDHDHLDPESAKLLKESYHDYIRQGMNLPAGPAKGRFKEIQLQLGKLETEFNRNLAEEKSGIWFTPAEVQGVPSSVTDAWERGEGENEGKIYMNFAYPNFLPTMKYAMHESTRKRASIANSNKLLNNKPIFDQVVALRDESARILGYANHATLRVENKMAKTPQRINEFLSDLRQKLGPGGEKEREALKALKKANLEHHNSTAADQDESKRDAGEEFNGHYYIWDQPFYNRLMLERDYSVDHEKLSEYFPLSTTLPRMLQIFERLLGLSFVEIPAGPERDAISPSGNGKDIVWHEDCHLYSVWDDLGSNNGSDKRLDDKRSDGQESGEQGGSESGSGSFSGYLYLDLHPRPDKYKHAANFNIQPGFLSSDGTRRYPATALVCNFSPPTNKKPSLLKHDEVVTLFHELGHGIHDLVGRTLYARFHGTNVVRDFVEAPSQMLENWCWTSQQLKFLSHHYSHLSDEYASAWKNEKKDNQTSTNNSSAAPSIRSNISTSAKEPTLPDKTLPDELIASLIKSKHVNDALFNLRQLHFGIFDMTIYQPDDHQQVLDWNFAELYNRLGYELQHLDTPAQDGEGDEWGNGHTTFGHIISGYDAGYYGYLFSQVYSADMFHTIFGKDPMNAEQGRRYRRLVLEKGGSRDALDLLTDFLGREPNSKAFEKELGLT